MTTFIVIGAMLCAGEFHRRSSTAAITTSTSATLLFIAAWFNTLTAKPGPLVVALAYDVFVKLSMIGLSVGLSNRLVTHRGVDKAVSRRVPATFIAAGLILIPWFLTVLALISRTDELHHLRLV
jgi:hypothetical protein